ncbi:hypothetical protein F66182_10621 [Fusarium sp. NRRL 66182]|nr:hypothetical protein F66182_10621 [Fusarium sp. NRRL 66182]
MVLILPTDSYSTMVLSRFGSLVADKENRYKSLEDSLDLNLWSVEPFSGTVRLRVDSTGTYESTRGRPSIRLESKESFQYGLFIADFQHMPPSQCGTWPAFWAYGDNWPTNGEIDILEGANLAYTNIMTGHTAEGCMLDPADEGLFSGDRLSLDCGVGSDNVGCGFTPPESDTSSYGDGFNAIGGGVYAMEWDSEYIKIWHFPRGAIPADIEEKEPDPRRWGLPQSLFGGSRCNVDEYFNNMNIVLNINFCGDYGEGTWGEFDTCQELAPTCREYVANNPKDFKNVYFDVSYIDVYARSQSVPPDEPAPPGETTIEDLEPGASVSSDTSAEDLGPTENSLPSDVPVEDSETADVIPDDSSTLDSEATDEPILDDPHTFISGDSGSFSTITRVASNSGDAPIPGNFSFTTRSVSSPEAPFSSEEPTTTTTMTGLSTVLVTIPGSGTNRPTVSPLPVATGGRSVNPANIGDYSYLGCFGSQTGFQTFEMAVESDDMSIEQCIRACNGLTYIGVFEGTCYCASRLDGDTRAVSNETVCNRPCPGNDDQFCGGFVTQSTSTRSRRSIPLRRDAPNNVLLTVYADISDAGQPEIPPPMAADGAPAVSDQPVVGSSSSTAPGSQYDSSADGSTEPTSPSSQDGSLPSNLVELSVSNDLAAPTILSADDAATLDAAASTDSADIIGIDGATDRDAVIGIAVTDTAVVLETNDGAAVSATTMVIGTTSATNTIMMVDGAADNIVDDGVTFDNPNIATATEAIPDTNREPVTSTITYLTVLPSNPTTLVPQESVVRLWYEQCSCKNPTLIQPPMETRTMECSGCGSKGENTVTLTIPLSVTVTVPGASSGQAQQTNDAAAAGASDGSPERTQQDNDAIAPVVPSGMGDGAAQGQTAPEVTTIVMTYVTTQTIYDTSTSPVSVETRTAMRTVVVTITNPSDDANLGPGTQAPIIPPQLTTPGSLATPTPTPTPGAPDRPVTVAGASRRGVEMSILFAMSIAAILMALP